MSKSISAFVPRVAAIAVAVLAGCAPLAAQQIAVGAGRWLTHRHVSDYQLWWSRFEVGPVALRPFGQVLLQSETSPGGVLVGGGADLTLRLNAAARPYGVVGASGGFLDLEGSVGLGAWGSWSAGIGAELTEIGGVALSVETRYHRLSRGRNQGWSLGGRLGSPLGRRAEPAASPPRAAPSPGPVPLTTAAFLDRGATIAGFATEAMGKPYEWGGTGENGFDCSGLIHHAYSKAGLTIPRRSADQARAGQEVARDLSALAPGDVLVFSDAPGGGSVTHVGLYLGGRQFIHSARTGVRTSLLSPEDPDGRWWFARWIGARRLL